MYQRVLEGEAHTRANGTGNGSVSSLLSSCGRDRPMDRVILSTGSSYGPGRPVDGVVLWTRAFLGSLTTTYQDLLPSEKKKKHFLFSYKGNS